MEDEVVEAVERDVLLVALAAEALRLLDAVVVVGLLEGARVRGLGEGTIDFGVLR